MTANKEDLHEINGTLEEINEKLMLEISNLEDRLENHLYSQSENQELLEEMKNILLSSVDKIGGKSKWFYGLFGIIFAGRGGIVLSRDEGCGALIVSIILFSISLYKFGAEHTHIQIGRIARENLRNHGYIVTYCQKLKEINNTYNELQFPELESIKKRLKL